jgi:glucose/mannose-6-phosphate isomerase
MGGSHLAADIVHSYNPNIQLLIHSDYGLPGCDVKTLKNSLVIASSYSGNTEEVIEGLETARKKKLAIAVIAVGGKLLELAKKYHLPYIQIPNTGIQPRSALGFSLVALLTLMNDKKALREARQLSTMLKPKSLESAGKLLAETLQNTVPVVYSSQVNAALAYNWKIKLNETGKIPAFYNVLPELNHNEMTGFDVVESTMPLSKNFKFLFLADSSDHPKNQKRMKIVEKMYQKRGLNALFVPLKGKTRFERIFNSLLLADWTAVYLASYYGLESEQVPMVEEFKKNIG